MTFEELLSKVRKMASNVDVSGVDFLAVQVNITGSNGGVFYVEVKNGVYHLTHKGAFYYHYYENFYTLSYIDKMWGIMRREAFPEEIRL